MRLYRLLALISFIACQMCWWANPAAAQDAPLTPCDTYATSPFDPQRQTTGVRVVNTGLAIPACHSAIQTYPTSARLNFQLGRAYFAAKNFREGSAFFLRAAEQGYAAAETALAMLFSLERECPGAIQTRLLGTPTLRNKDLRLLKTAWVPCMSRVWGVHGILL